MKVRSFNGLSSPNGATHASPGRQPRVTDATRAEPCRGDTSAGKQRLGVPLFRPFRASRFLELKPGASLLRRWPRAGIFRPIGAFGGKRPP